MNLSVLSAVHLRSAAPQDPRSPSQQSSSERTDLGQARPREVHRLRDLKVSDPPDTEASLPKVGSREENNSESIESTWVSLPRYFSSGIKTSICSLLQVAKVLGCCKKQSKTGHWALIPCDGGALGSLTANDDFSDEGAPVRDISLNLFIFLVATTKARRQID